MRKQLSNHAHALETERAFWDNFHHEHQATRAPFLKSYSLHVLIAVRGGRVDGTFFDCHPLLATNLVD